MESKRTKGDHFYVAHHQWIDSYDVNRGDETRICRLNYGDRLPKKEVEANAELIAEAFNIANETGKTPRELQEENEKLKAFKDYVHKRLDDAGIEKEPNGEHSKHGCRIGDRLDIIIQKSSK